MKALLVGGTSESHKKVIWDRIEPFLSQIDDVVQIADVLIAIWQRPDTLESGLKLPDEYRHEDVFQGKVGLVLYLADQAFKDDLEHDPPIKWPIKPKIGDWVVYRVSDGWPFYLGEQPCRLVNERGIRLIIKRPDIVY